MITGVERSYDVAGSITTLWKTFFVTCIAWLVVLSSRYVLVRYIQMKMRKLALQYRLCPVFDPRIIVGPGGAVLVKAMSKMQKEEMLKRIELVENQKVLSKEEEEEDEDEGLVVAAEENRNEDEDIEQSVLTMTAPEGLELIAKRTKDYMTTRATVLFLIVFSWPSYFQACGGGMVSGVVYGQVIGGLMMFLGVVLFGLFVAYFLLVITLGTSYRRSNAIDVLDLCYEMQRTNVETSLVLHVLGNKYGRWSVANRDYRRMFYDVGHLFDFWSFSHGNADEDDRILKEKKEQELQKDNDGTKVVVQKKQAYEARRPYLFSIYVLFHMSIQGLIVGGEAESDASGLSQCLHYFLLQIFFTLFLFYLAPHNVPIGNVLHMVSTFVFTATVGLLLFVHPVARSNMIDLTGGGGGSTIGNDSGAGLNPHLMEQMLLFLTVLCTLPLFMVEVVGTVVQVRLFVLFVWKGYVVDSVYRMYKSIQLCGQWCKSEIKKQQQIRKRNKQKYQFNQQQNSRRQSTKISDDTAPQDGSLMGKTENVSIDLAQQQMNRYVNKEEENEEFALDVNGIGKKNKELNGFTFTTEEIANWIPDPRSSSGYNNNNNDDDDDDREEDDKEQDTSSEDDEQELDEFGLSTHLSYDDREAAANKIEEELKVVYGQLKQLGFDPAAGGTKKEEHMAEHLKISKKMMEKKWVRSELRGTYGKQMLVSLGATKKVLTQDRNEALWSIEKKKREKERRRKEWKKYSESQQGNSNVNVANLGLDSNKGKSGGRGRD